MASEIVWHDRKRTFLGLPFSFTRYSLSEERLFINTGFFTMRENEVRLYRILDVQLTRTLGQRIFGLGTISVCSSDKSMGNFEIKSIKHPRDVKEQLSALVEAERRARGVVNREFMGNDGNDCDCDHDFEDSAE